MGFLDNISTVEFKPVVKPDVQKTVFQYEEMDSYKWYLYENFPDQYTIAKPQWMSEQEWRTAINPRNYKTDSSMMEYIEQKNREKTLTDWKQRTSWQNSTIPDDITDEFERMNYLIGAWARNIDKQDGGDRYVTPRDLQYFRYAAAGGTDPMDIYTSNQRNRVQYSGYNPVKYTQNYYEPQSSRIVYDTQPSFTPDMKQAIEHEVNQRMATPVMAPTSQLEQETINGFQQRLNQNRRNRGMLTSRYMAETYDAQVDNFAPPLGGDIVPHTGDVVNFPTTHNGVAVYTDNHTNNPYYGNTLQNGYNIYGEYNPNNLQMYYPNGIVNYQRYRAADIPVGSGVYMDANGRVTRIQGVEVFNVKPTEPSAPPRYLDQYELRKAMRGTLPTQDTPMPSSDLYTYLNGFNVTGINGVEEIAVELRRNNPNKNNSFYYSNESVLPPTQYQKLYDKDMELVANNYSQFIAGRRRAYGTQYAMPRDTIPRHDIIEQTGDIVVDEKEPEDNGVSSGGGDNIMIEHVPRPEEPVPIDTGKINIHYTDEQSGKMINETEAPVDINGQEVSIPDVKHPPDDEDNSGMDSSFGDVDDYESSNFTKIRKKRPRRTDEEMRIKKGLHQTGKKNNKRKDG